MRQRDFERIILQALEQMPPHFREALDNIDIQVQWRPSPGELRRAGLRRGQSLLGLYVGVPLPSRSHYNSLTLPDTIIIYQGTHERVCRDEAEMVEQVQKTLLHEIGHYMGIDEDRLRELGAG